MCVLVCLVFALDLWSAFFVVLVVCVVFGVVYSCCCCCFCYVSVSVFVLLFVVFVLVCFGLGVDCVLFLAS